MTNIKIIKEPMITLEEQEGKKHLLLKVRYSTIANGEETYHTVVEDIDSFDLETEIIS